MIYLDNSATTSLCDRAKDNIAQAIEHFGNPSSLHSVGYEAHTMLDAARRTVAGSLGLRSASGYEVVFTGSGSEANNMATVGCATAKERHESRRIITTDSEHPSISEPLAYLERQGFEIVRLGTRGGVIDREEFSREIARGAFLVSIMLVNNETGANYDVAALFAEAKRVCPGVITHTDATQGYMKVAFSPAKLGADLVTVSAHKIHGPKGVGALCISPEMIKMKKIVPVIRGGGQENGFRSGTENMIGIAGFCGAVEEGFPHLSENIAYMTGLREYAEEKLGGLDGVRLNIPSGARAPHILNLTLPSIKSETMVHFLSSKGIAVSGGSACSSHNEHISASLLGFGLDKKDAVCSLRISLCENNTKSELDELACRIAEGIKTLVKIK